MPLGPHKLIALTCMLGIALIIAMPVISQVINSNAVRVRPDFPTHGTTGDRSPVARHLYVESAK